MIAITPDTRMQSPYGGIVWLGRNSSIGYVDVTPWAHKGDRPRVVSLQGALAVRLAALLRDDEPAQRILSEMQQALGET